MPLGRLVGIHFDALQVEYGAIYVVDAYIGYTVGFGFRRIHDILQRSVGATFAVFVFIPFDCAERACRDIDL